MASTDQPTGYGKPTHQQPKSSVLKSFMHRRNNSDGSNLPPAALTAPSGLPEVVPGHAEQRYISGFSKHPAALAEIQTNKVDAMGSRSPVRRADAQAADRKSPTKSFSTISIKSFAKKDAEQDQEAASPKKAKKTRSTTNLAGLLSRPKSFKNLRQTSEEDARSRRDKENRAPQEATRPPIYAQYSSGALENRVSFDVYGHSNASSHGGSSNDSSMRVDKKPRPQSYHVPRTEQSRVNDLASPVKAGSENSKASPSKTQRGLRLFTSGSGLKQQQPGTLQPSEFVLDPKDIDTHLEAMLDRRNIPDNQRYKMRNLADTIKMEFIRQDWAESQGALNRPGSNDSDSSMNGAHARKDTKPKHSRGMSFTLSRSSGKKSEPSSPSKKQKSDGTLGRRFRSKSTESVTSERPSSSGSGSGGGILSKMKFSQGPKDFVEYLRKVQKPELVEVGKLHKLRQLLRNETVSWIEEFIRLGGMEEMVGLLNRITAVEWREEHEDALLHETLLCLKALCTTAQGMQYLDSIQTTIFPSLLHLIFDPEKKGPSEFTTRNIITSIAFAYIQAAHSQQRLVRARTVLSHLRDPEPKEEERPVEFVLDMRRDRPYRVWCKEAVGVTKEVFWIFLHHLNIVFLPRDKEGLLGPTRLSSLEYMQAHFPQERPPVPAAPYVGGVEWDATNYLTSHLDLLNAILACTPSLEERNDLRHLLKISGFEKCMGGSMRLCKEKFYPGLHDALRTWAAAAADDGWDVRDVRYGPPAESRSPVRKHGFGNGGSPGKKKEDEAAPRIEMPKLDFGLEAASKGANGGGAKSDDWLS